MIPSQLGLDFSAPFTNVIPNVLENSQVTKYN
jgi:hypothetical protein